MHGRLSVSFSIVFLFASICWGSEFKLYLEEPVENIAGKLALGDATATLADFDKNGTVDFTDFLLFAAAFGSSRGNDKYEQRLDLNNNGSIDFEDFLLFASVFGKAASVPSGESDLIVESLSANNGTPIIEQSFTLHARVRNQGDAPAMATVLRYYRSSSGESLEDTVGVGTGRISSLSAGDTSSTSVDLNAPSDVGTYYYGACIDSVAGERDTGNNCSDIVAITTKSKTPPPRPSHLGDCEVGMNLQSGKSCNYYSDGHTVRFSVKSDGNACRASNKTVIRIIFGARVRVNIREACVSHNITRDDVYDEPDFAASKNSDGSWTIKSVP